MRLFKNILYFLFYKVSRRFDFLTYHNSLNYKYLKCSNTRSEFDDNEIEIGTSSTLSHLNISMKYKNLIKLIQMRGVFHIDGIYKIKIQRYPTGFMILVILQVFLISYLYF